MAKRKGNKGKGSKKNKPIPDPAQKLKSKDSFSLDPDNSPEEKLKKSLSEHVSFSFAYLNFDNKKFTLELDCIKQKKGKYLDKLLDRLKTVLSMTLANFKHRDQKFGPLKSHEINFDTTTEKEGYTCIPDEQIRTSLPWQFALTTGSPNIATNPMGRIHGIIIGNTFYIVWLDPDHLLYPKKKK